MRVERRPCQICGTITQSIGYKSYICGACSIFYRRNFRNREQMRCRKEGDCNLQSGNRNSCRGCRMRMCRSLGLRMVGNSLVIQCNGYPKDDIEDDTTLPDSGIFAQSIPSTSTNVGNPIQRPQPSTSAIIAVPTTSTSLTEADAATTNVATVVIAGSTTISATNLLPNALSGVTATLLTKAANGIKAEPVAVSPSASATTSVSDPRSVGSLQMPATPLMNVFDPAPSLYNSADSVTVDDIVVGAVVSLKPVPISVHGSPIALPSSSTLNPENAAEFPLMVKTIGAFARFEERQRCLASIMKGSEVSVDGEYFEINMQIYAIMENRTLRLACITIAELLQGCVDLNIQERSAILKSTILEVSSFYKYALTSRAFPDLNNQHMALYPGFFCMLDNIARFMKADYERTKHVMEPLWGVARIGISRFRYLQPTFDEIAVMFAIIVWENVERLGIMKKYAVEQREKLYKEFGYYLSMQYGFQTASVRIIRLLTLLCDVKMYTTAYEDTYSLLGIFLPADRDAFWSNKPHVSDTQLANLAFAPAEAAAP